MNGKRLQFAASPGVVGKVRDAVRRLAADLGAAESVGEQLALVADELINNAIEHGSVYRRRGEALALELRGDPRLLLLHVALALHEDHPAA
jgi:anti-sigma regulatory factor (Ser/Thr protein kinase)